MGPLQRELDLFHDVLQQPADARAAFIENTCASDPALILRLRGLLEAHERAERSERHSPARDISVHTFARAPHCIGPYRVLEMIGEGAMGVVYAAEQTEPFRRRVAIKVIKLGMDSKEIVARFEAERQALAMMDHPCVAKALDAGVTEQGRPYFVMELVKGLPLMEYCAKHRLPLRDRLRLFVQVCAAIQHAHQKGIIHRDLKPSNILVALQEERPVPKVIDFGVAKATAARLTDRTVFTEQGRLIGTPEYMSPEQAEMTGLDVDTRTDVYSLGIILYELLTGAVPFDAQTLRGSGFPELLRNIREVDPPRPSSRASELARTPKSPPTFDTPARALRGELDWIVMRAIAKDRTRRYATASALGDDVERYLADRPVLAGPPSAAYAIRKFVRRHRYATAMIVVASISTVLGLAGLSIGLMQARAAEALATRRAHNAQAAADFLEQVLFQADPEFAGRPLTLDELMQIAGSSVEQKLGAYPEVEASVRESIGVAYRRRSMFALAEPHLRRSLELRRQLFGEHATDTANSLVAEANLVFEYEGRIDDSLAMLHEARDTYAAEDPDGLPVAWVLLDIGFSSLAGDRLAEAAQAFERCRALLARERGAEHPDVSRPVRGLALVALARGDLDEADRFARAAVALCEGKPAVYIGARAKLVLAQVLIQEGRLTEAATLLDQAGGQFALTVGPEHIRVAERDAILAELQLHLREFESAEVVSARCEAMRRGLLHPDHWSILEARLLHTQSEIGLGRTQGADDQLREIDERVRDRLGPDHPLRIRVAEARLELALAMGDESLAAIQGERLSSLQEARDRRLRSEAASIPTPAGG